MSWKLRNRFESGVQICKGLSVRCGDVKSELRDRAIFTTDSCCVFSGGCDTYEIAYTNLWKPLVILFC